MGGTPAQRYWNERDATGRDPDHLAHCPTRPLSCRYSRATASGSRRSTSWSRWTAVTPTRSPWNTCRTRASSGSELDGQGPAPSRPVRSSTSELGFRPSGFPIPTTADHPIPARAGPLWRCCQSNRYGPLLHQTSVGAESGSDDLSDVFDGERHGGGLVDDVAGRLWVEGDHDPAATLWTVDLGDLAVDLGHAPLKGDEIAVLGVVLHRFLLHHGLGMSRNSASASATTSFMVPARASSARRYCW